MADADNPTLLFIYSADSLAAQLEKKSNMYGALSANQNKQATVLEKHNGFSEKKEWDVITPERIKAASKKAADFGRPVLPIVVVHGEEKEGTTEFEIKIHGDSNAQPIQSALKEIFEPIPKDKRSGIVLISCFSGSALDELGDIFPNGASVVTMADAHESVSSDEIEKLATRIVEKHKKEGAVKAEDFFEEFYLKGMDQTPGAALYVVGKGIYKPELALEELLKKPVGKRIDENDKEIKELVKQHPEIAAAVKAINTVEKITDIPKGELPKAMYVAHKLAKAPQMSIEQEKKNSALDNAIRAKDMKAYLKAIDNGTNINKWSFNSLYFGVSKHTVLSEVIEHGTPEMLDDLLNKRGFNLKDYKDYNTNYTPLDRALHEDNGEIIKHLWNTLKARESSLEKDSLQDHLKPYLNPPPTDHHAFHENVRKDIQTMLAGIPISGAMNDQLNVLPLINTAKRDIT